MGILADKFGRKNTLLLTTVLGDVSVILMSRLDNIYPGLMLCLVSFSLLTTSLLIASPIVGDYVRPEY